MEKNQERDENMPMLMTQLDFLTKPVMGGCHKAVNAIGSSSGMCSDNENLEAVYNEEVQLLLNEVGGSFPSYPRPGEK
ncbi:hypothetical protein MTR67_018156 [Solanum verrucosum]|uniref:Uncharacterized protein n=1 Tax=Solanum verrucosum TaxID=315347 RepID=A0AAF0TM42_SOLVR|nr:hypothetical protein MTR67_018156 [Solanum verrucosum]